MADRVGSLIGIRVNAGPVNVKVTDYDYDPETKVNRAVRSDDNQHARSAICSKSGVLRGTGFVDPSDAGCALLLASAAGAPGTADDYTSVEFLIDVSETAASRHGMNMGTCKGVIRSIPGATNEDGMTRVNFEMHSQAGVTYSSTLT